jgi:hypothetical protein
VLWNYATAAQIASGDTGCIPSTVPGFPCANAYYPVDLEGSVAVVQNLTSSLVAYNASTGAQLGSIDFESLPGSPVSWWKLATDGSYIVAGSASALTAWSPSGGQLFSVSGDYSQATVFAAPGQVQVALGPAGQNVVATVAVPSGSVTVSPAFVGQFLLWFTDGSHFMTDQGSLAWVYSSAGVQQQQFTVPPGTTIEEGQGSWFWTLDGLGNWSLYAVGNSQPQLTETNVGPGAAYASTVALFTPASIIIVDLSGASPITSTENLPAPVVAGEYAAISSSQWMLAFGSVLVDGASLSGPPRYFDCGAVTGIAGSGTQFAVTTASGQILYYNASDNTLEGTISLPNYSTPAAGIVMDPRSNLQNNAYRYPTIAVSTDGTQLVADANTSGTNSVLNAYALPAGTLTSSTSPPPCYAILTPVTGGNASWCSTIEALGAPDAIQLSPDGTLVAASIGTDTFTTSILQNGTLVTTVPGYVVGWLDNSRVLVMNLAINDVSLDYYEYNGSVIYSSSGTQLATPSVPDLSAIQVVGSESVYSPVYNAIYSLTNGAVLWTSASGNALGTSWITMGAVAGSETVFASSHWVLAEPN